MPQDSPRGSTTRSRAPITADLAVFLCIEFPLKTTRFFVRRKSFCCLLWCSQGIVGDNWKPGTPRAL